MTALKSTNRKLPGLLKAQDYNWPRVTADSFDWLKRITGSAHIQREGTVWGLHAERGDSLGGTNVLGPVLTSQEFSEIEQQGLC